MLKFLGHASPVDEGAKCIKRMLHRCGPERLRCLEDFSLNHLFATAGGVASVYLSVSALSWILASSLCLCLRAPVGYLPDRLTASVAGIIIRNNCAVSLLLRPRRNTRVAALPLK